MKDTHSARLGVRAELITTCKDGPMGDISLR